MNPDKKNEQSDLFSPKSKATFSRRASGTLVTTDESSSIIHPLAFDIHEAIKQDDTVDPDSDYLYKCTFGGCDRKFKSAFERNRHEKNVHSSPEPCPYCGKPLKTKGRKDLLQRHLKTCPSYTVD